MLPFGYDHLQFEDLDHWRCNHVSKFKFPFHRVHEQKPRRSISASELLKLVSKLANNPCFICRSSTGSDRIWEWAHPWRQIYPTQSHSSSILEKQTYAQVNTVVSASSATKENSSTPFPDPFPKVSQLIKKTRTSMSLGSMGFRKKSFLSRSNTSPHGDSEGPHPMITRRKGSVPLRKISLDIQPKEGPTYLDRTCESPVHPLHPLQFFCDGQCRERGEGVNYEEPLVVSLYFQKCCYSAQVYSKRWLCRHALMPREPGSRNIRLWLKYWLICSVSTELSHTTLSEYLMASHRV